MKFVSSLYVGYELMVFFGFIDVCALVRIFVNKAIGPTKAKKLGNSGYRSVKVLIVLVYARLKRLCNETRIVEHLKECQWVTKTLGLVAVPYRTIVDGWWRRYISF